MVTTCLPTQFLTISLKLLGVVIFNTVQVVISNYYNVLLQITEVQTDAVHKFCARQKMARWSYTLPHDRRKRFNMFKHLLFDDNTRIIFANLPKVSMNHYYYYYYYRHATKENSEWISEKGYT